MENGLIGEFARDKIKALEAAIEEGVVSEVLYRQVDMIGDERIRDYLMRRMARQNVDAEIAYHEAKIRELRNRRGI